MHFTSITLHKQKAIQEKVEGRLKMQQLCIKVICLGEKNLVYSSQKKIKKLPIYQLAVCQFSSINTATAKILNSVFLQCKMQISFIDDSEYIT